MTELACGETAEQQTPDADCNSNPTGGCGGAGAVMATTTTAVTTTQDHFASSCLSTTSQDAEFIQDSSDYQWFIDYGYRDSGNLQHASVLSSLCTSYTGEDLGFYDAMSKNLDANLAEADMESFRTEDIHSLLTTLPTMCTDMQMVQENNREGEMFASMSGSLMEKIELDSSLSQQTSSQGDESTGLIDTMSICKSELLFSPVKEVPLGHNYSVDSLDCELPNEQDIMLTCQANKNNYTIAFEGSVTTYSEVSEEHDIEKPTEGRVKLHLDDMTKSDLGLTTWSKLKKRSCEMKLRRHPSGNNNTTDSNSTQYDGSILSSSSNNALKSQSMPNLYKQKTNQNYSNFNNAMNSSSIESYNYFPTNCIKVFDIQHQQTNSGSLFSDIASSMDGFDSSCSDKTNKIKAPNLNLVKRFIKQKSISAEGMSTPDLDKSSASEYSGGTSAVSLDNKLNKMSTSVNDNDNLRKNQLNNWETTLIPEKARLNRNVNNNNSIDRSATKISSASISMCSSSEATETTKRFRPRLKPKFDFVNRSMQTSNIQIVEPSFLNKIKQKPVYVLYPEYTLPSLDFLKSDQDFSKILLYPQKFVPFSQNKQRPFSCNDMEMLKKKGFGHVKDWASLTFLLPEEYRQLLATEVPEVVGQMKVPSGRVNFGKKRPQSCDLTGYTNVSSSSSTATQPSSGYRGSSTMLLTDSQNQEKQNLNPLFIYRYDSVTSSEASVTMPDKKYAPALPKRSTSLDVTPRRPALPKGILRKAETKRRKSESFSTDEGVEAGNDSSLENNDCCIARPPTPPLPKHLDPSASQDELQQLEDFLKQSGFSCSENEDFEDISKLRTCVNKFLSLKINRKSVSFQNIPRQSNLFKLPEEGEECSPKQSPKKDKLLVSKNPLVQAVKDAVDQIIDHFANANNHDELTIIGSGAQSAKLVLGTLCPALYAILGDGLKSHIETTFGKIGNSVWQVVESSSHDGPLTKSLNELVMRINSEDLITEGLIKFNAFVFGLLNVQSLDVWISYLRMRESIIRKHYNNDGLLLLALTSGQSFRGLIDILITTLQPLNMLPFQLDLMFQYRELHISMKRMESFHQSPTSPTKSQLSSKQWALFKLVKSIAETQEESPPPEIRKPRPRSFVDHNNVSDITNAQKKRWSDVHLGSKLHQAFDRLDSDEEYTDSLEPVKSKEVTPPPPHGVKFRRLQMKWEMLANESDSARTSNIGSDQEETKTPESPQHSSASKSRIPRLIPSPVRANSTLTSASLQKTSIPVKKTGIPVGGVIRRQNTETNIKTKKVEHGTPTRSSRMDKHEIATNNTLKHPSRPTSLPYNHQIQTKNTKIAAPRRAISSSLNRVTTKSTTKSTPKVVRTLTHRLPSDNGHLSFNEGERLTVMLEVDEKWLLCCRGTQKGLVPKSAVLVLESDKPF